jgi:hypothetical protein
VRLQAQRVQVRVDVRGGHGHHFLEHLAAFLHEGLVAGVGVGVFAAVEEAALLRMLLLYCVTSLVPRMRQRSADAPCLRLRR